MSRTTKEQFRIITQLGQARISLDAAGQWYVAQNVHFVAVAGDPTRTSICGRGDTPEAAVEAHWLELARDYPDKYVEYMQEGQPHFARWSGRRWITGQGAPGVMPEPPETGRG